jgi:hypothetical protein
MRIAGTCWEIRTEADINWGKEEIYRHNPMLTTHDSNIEMCVDVTPPEEKSSEWQNLINSNRPYYDTVSDEYWVVVKLFDKDGMILPEAEQVSAKPFTGEEARKREWL